MSTQPNGLLVGEVTPIDAEAAQAARGEYQAARASCSNSSPSRVGPQNFPAEREFDDASWVGYRLAELLPLPLHIKQSMLEINDAQVRLQVLQKFLAQQGLTLIRVRYSLLRRVHAGQSRDQDGEEERAGDLLDHAYAPRLPRQRRDVAEARAGEYRDAEVQRVGELSRLGCPRIENESGSRSSRRSRRSRPTERPA